MSTLAMPSARRAVTMQLARLQALSERTVLMAAIGIATVARFALSLPHTTPRYFPDEYLYAALSRSLGHGSLTIRGEPAHFPALLESVVQAPLWLLGGVELPFRMTQLLHAFIAALACIPVYAIARRLELPRWQRLTCAAFTPLLPVFLYTSYLTADVLATTLALAAIAVGVTALVRPRPRLEIGFVALAGLATLARFQYVVLVPAFALSALAMCRCSIPTWARRFRVTTACAALAIVAGAALGPSRLLGYYDGVLHFHVSPLSMAKWGGTDLMLLGYSTGVALAPAALVGFVGALVRPRTAWERALAYLSAATFGALLVEVSLYATNGSSRFQERYLMALLPLVAPFACLGLQRAQARRPRLAIVGLSLVLLVGAMRTSLTDYTLDGNGQDSPMLQAVVWLVTRVGTGSAGLIVSLVAAATLAVAALAVFDRRRGPAIILACAVLVATAGTAAAFRDDVRGSRSSTYLALGSDPQWVDHSNLGTTQMLVPRDSVRWIVSQQLFWNRSIDRVLTLPGAPAADAFQNDAVRIDDHGVLRRGAEAVSSPLLIQEYAASAQLEDASVVARLKTSTLWKPDGAVRFVSATDGRYFDGWLGWPTARVTVWPKASGPRTGVLCLPLSLPAIGHSTTLDLSAPGYARTVTLRSGQSVLVAIPRTVTRPWQLHLLSRRPFQIGPRLLSARVGRPRFLTGKASSAACR